MHLRNPWVPPQRPRQRPHGDDGYVGSLPRVLGAEAAKSGDRMCRDLSSRKEVPISYA